MSTMRTMTKTSAWTCSTCWTMTRKSCHWTSTHVDTSYLSLCHCAAEKLSVSWPSPPPAQTPPHAGVFQRLLRPIYCLRTRMTCAWFSRLCVWHNSERICCNLPRKKDFFHGCGTHLWTYWFRMLTFGQLLSPMRPGNWFVIGSPTFTFK